MLKECTGLTKIIAPYIPLILDDIVNDIQYFVNIELPPTSGNWRWSTPTGSGGYYTFNEISYDENGWTMELINPFVWDFSQKKHLTESKVFFYKLHRFIYKNI